MIGRYMTRRHTPISRRTLLRGAGAGLALPWLEAMMPASAHAAQRAPVRMAFLYMPNGAREDGLTRFKRGWATAKCLSSQSHITKHSRGEQPVPSLAEQLPAALKGDPALRRAVLDALTV